MAKEKQKISLVWAAACTSSSIDQSTNAISLFNIIEELTVNNLLAQPTKEQQEMIASGKPIATPFNHEVISVWLRDNIGTETKVDMALELVDPSGKVLARHT